MLAVPVNHLRDGAPVSAGLYHSSGVCLLPAGTVVNQGVLHLLDDEDISELYAADASESEAELRLKLTHVSLAVEELQPGIKLDRSVYDGDGKLLLDGDRPVSEALCEGLQRRGITQIFVRKTDDELALGDGKTLREAIRKALEGEGIPAKEAPAPGKVEEQVAAFREMTYKPASPEQITTRYLNQSIERGWVTDARPSGEPLAQLIRDTRLIGPAPEEEKEALTDLVTESLGVVDEVFHCLEQGHRRINVDALDRVICNAMGGLIRHRELLTLCSFNGRNGADYLISHSVATAVLSVSIGAALGYSAEQLKCLGYGAMLADVGMLRVPVDIRGKMSKLTGREVAEIKRHPVHGIDMLLRFSQIPKEVPYIVYQSHERPDGSGYPCRKRGVIIHSFARIVHAADTFSAMVAVRPYRQARLPYFAMEHLVRMCSSKALDAKVVRALLKIHALCPVGSFVKLSDGRYGRVVAANPEDFSNPVVAILMDQDQQPDPELSRVNLSENESLSIAQAIDPATINLSQEWMAGF